jgi:excisionase family DNA binding protein
MFYLVSSRHSIVGIIRSMADALVSTDTPLSPSLPQDLTDLLTVEQAALHLQLSQSSIRSYIRQGRLKAFRVAGLRKVLIPRAELLGLLEPAREGWETTE